ncbi:MAG: hypothetical protein HFH93_11215 [Lachnospiraceae bacterium]|nr:hypothetical protein [Lachnospiraceae bacterium]
MRDFLQNPWVCGIGGGIISGIIVFYITKWLMGKKDNSMYLRQIQSANTEVISILKPYIADNGLPNEKIMSAIIASTARKYGVEINELYKIKVFCEELIKEIVENVYVSSEKKKEYTDQLADYINNISIDGKKEMEVVSEAKEVVTRKDIGDRYRNLLSATLALMSMLITIFASLLMAVKDTENMMQSLFIDREWYMFLVILTTTLFSTVPLMCTIMLKELRKKRERREEKQLRKIEEEDRDNSESNEK